MAGGPGGSRRRAVAVLPAVGDGHDRQRDGRASNRHVQEKDGRHENASTSQPPATGPSAEVIAPTPAQVPIACAALLVVEDRADDREAARHQQRRAHPLHGARRDQGGGARREAAADRGQREQHDPGDEHRAPSEPSPSRAAHQHQRAEKQQIGIDDPLRSPPRSRLQFALDGRQGDVDHRAVDEGHARAENGRGQREFLTPARVDEAGMLRANGERVARTRLSGQDGRGTALERRCVLVGQVRSRVMNGLQHSNAGGSAKGAKDARAAANAPRAAPGRPAYTSEGARRSVSPSASAPPAPFEARPAAGSWCSRLACINR